MYYSLHPQNEEVPSLTLAQTLLSAVTVSDRYAC